MLILKSPGWPGRPREPHPDEAGPINAANNKGKRLGRPFRLDEKSVNSSLLYYLLQFMDRMVEQAVPGKSKKVIGMGVYLYTPSALRERSSDCL